MNTEVSDCCGAAVDVSPGVEATSCWMCRGCGKPCDAVTAMPGDDRP